MNRSLSVMAILVLAGCSSPPKPKPVAPPVPEVDRTNAASTSMAEFREHVKGAQKQLDVMIGSLNGLSTAGAALKPAYTKYVAELNCTEHYSAALIVDAGAMRMKGQEYFRPWEDAIGQIKDEETRSKSRSRSGERSREYATIEDAMGTAKSKWVSLMAGLQEVRQYLAIDLTSTGVASLSATITKANLDATALKNALSIVSASLDKVQPDFAVQAKN